MLHADVIADRSGPRLPALRAIGSRAWTRGRLLVVAVARAWSARRAERMLMEMPDQLLKDIGISRCDIRRAVREGQLDVTSPACRLEFVAPAG
jgi:uncharacterized protein YjiS (DUF1127 family)